MPARARAIGPAPRNVEARAEALFTEEKYLEAALVWTNALESVPESSDSRGQRNSWASGAVNAYKLAFERYRTQCSVVVDGINLADRYLDGLITVYGKQATNADDYAGMYALRAELDQVRSAHDCPAPTNKTANLPEPVSVDVHAPGSEELPEGSDTPAATNNSPAPRGTLGLAIGTGVSASLMVGMAVGSLVTYMQIRKPDGSAYDQIYQAAVDKMVKNDATTDLCVEGRGVSEVATACDRWKSLKHTYIATSVLAGVFAVSTAVIAGLLIKKRRETGRATAFLRRHQAHLGATPQRGGVAVAAGFRF